VSTRRIVADIWADSPEPGCTSNCVRKSHLGWNKQAVADCRPEVVGKEEVGRKEAGTEVVAQVVSLSPVVLSLQVSAPHGRMEDVMAEFANRDFLKRLISVFQISPIPIA
jgi:hypothetical protein